METKKFKTRTIFSQRNNPTGQNEAWVIALDMGYSAVKGMSRNAVFSFPCYAKKLAKNAVSLAQPMNTDILYRDSGSEDIWAVGAKAESMISIEMTNDNNATLYGRNRYFSEIFRVTSRVGLAMAMMTNEHGSPKGKKLIVQTGLPSAYYIDDRNLLKQALAGQFSFDVKLGAGPWQHFEFQLAENDIHVVQQPMGTLISLATDKEGRPTQDAQQLLRSNVLVFDPGFRTGDTAYIKGGTIDVENDCHTIDDLSMIEILSRTAEALKETKEFKEAHGASISVPVIQTCLETGCVRVIDKVALKSTKFDFSNILEEQSKAVCEVAIKKLSEIYNYFIEVDYLVITGGTGAAWSNYIRERLKDLETLTILSGNRNDELPHIFSNVRGYYMYRINQKLR